MARVLEFSFDPDDTDRVVEQLKTVEGVLGISLQRGSSVKPPGDIVTIKATSDGSRAALQAIEELGIEPSVLSSSPQSLMPGQGQELLEIETSEGPWEELALLLRGESNVTYNYLALMLLAGAIAGIGLWTDNVQIVIGAMIITPGFHPVLRVPYAMMTRPVVSIGRALQSVGLGYATLIAGAALIYLVMSAMDGRPDALETRFWVMHWSTYGGPGIVLSAVAALAGAFTVTANRSVLAAGAMVALSLVPAASIAGMAVVSGDMGLAGRGLARWAIDVAMVAVLGGAVMFTKRRTIHRRRPLP